MENTSCDFVGLLLACQRRNDLEGEVKGVGGGLCRDEVTALGYRGGGDRRSVQMLLEAWIGNSLVSLQETSLAEDGGCCANSAESLLRHHRCTLRRWIGRRGWRCRELR